MPHRPARKNFGYEPIFEYMDENHLTPRQFQTVYERDHSTPMSRAQKRVIGLLHSYKTRSRAKAFHLARRESTDRAVVVRGKRVQVTYLRDNRGQLHKRGAKGKFERFTSKERREFHPRVNKRRPSRVKKGAS